LRQPVAGALTQLLYAFHAFNARGQVWTEETRVTRFVCQASHRGQVLIDGISCQTAGF